MEKNDAWEIFLSDNRRYADIINGVGCHGEQRVKAEDLAEADTGNEKGGKRDLLRRTAFGANFMIIGIENQETLDYTMPFRNLCYDVKSYGKQLSQVKKEVRKRVKGLSPGEYLYGFRENDRLRPVITIVLYSGKEPWTGNRKLHDMLDFSEIPESIKEMVQDYKINLIEIRNFEHTEVFQTDVKQVFDFIRCAENKETLKNLVENDPYYSNMEPEAFEVAMLYSNNREMIQMEKYGSKEGKRDMSSAIREMIEDGKKEGIEQGVIMTLRALVSDGLLSMKEAAKRAGISETEFSERMKQEAQTFPIDSKDE